MNHEDYTGHDPDDGEGELRLGGGSCSLNQVLPQDKRVQ